MRKLQAAIALVLIFLVSGVVLTQGKAPFWNYPLTDELVERAIAEGSVRGEDFGLWMTDSGSAWGNAFVDDQSGTTGFSVLIYSPYSWINQQASWAAKKYKKFDAAELNWEAMDLLRVYANPDVPLRLGNLGATGVEHVVIRSTAKHNFEVAQPVEIEGDLEYTQNSFGAEWAGESQVAMFLMEDVLRIAAADKKGEFFILIIGVSGEEKKFKVKTKHFKRLP
jgi:hypothetical protein